MPFYFFLCLCLFSSLSSFLIGIEEGENLDLLDEWEQEEFSETFLKRERYPYNTAVDLALWKQLEPYFLPINHPIKERVDALFKKHRVTQSKESFEKAGFGKVKIRKPTNIIVGKHPDFNGYVFKVYLDTQPELVEWSNWVNRIEGAKAIQACLERHGFKHFKVPKKWIYPLPEYPTPLASARFHPKHFILIVEDMHILHSQDNLKAFKKKLTFQWLDELFIILKEEGLIDSVYPDNIPFSKEGKIAFVDTEHYHLYPVPFHKLTFYLDTAQQTYWKSLIQNDK